LAMAHGLRACWSTPILGSDETVLGTFAIYSREPGRPTAQHQRLIGQITHLASVAIEHKYAVDKLRQDEREFRQIVEAIPQLILVLTPEGSPLYANALLLEYIGLTLDDVRAGDFRARVFHPDDVERLKDERRQALARGVSFEMEQRVLRKGGQYRWFLTRFNPVLDGQGHVIRW